MKSPWAQLSSLPRANRLRDGWGMAQRQTVGTHGTILDTLDPSSGILKMMFMILNDWFLMFPFWGGRDPGSEYLSHFPFREYMVLRCIE